MKLKKLIKESTWGKRAFGEKLPKETIESLPDHRWVI